MTTKHFCVCFQLFAAYHHSPICCWLITEFSWNLKTSNHTVAYFIEANKLVLFFLGLIIIHCNGLTLNHFIIIVIFDFFSQLHNVNYSKHICRFVCMCSLNFWRVDVRSSIYAMWIVCIAHIYCIIQVDFQLDCGCFQCAHWTAHIHNERYIICWHCYAFEALLYTNAEDKTDEVKYLPWHYECIRDWVKPVLSRFVLHDIKIWVYALFICHSKHETLWTGMKLTT